MKTTVQFVRYSLAVALSLWISACGNGNGKEEVSLFPVRSGNTYGYIDREGKFVINPQFSYATVFRDGVALVKTTGDKPKFGYINPEGKFMIQPLYIHATVFNEGIAFVVAENAAPTAINVRGETLFTLQNAEQVTYFKEGLAAFSVTTDNEGEKWGFVDTEGKVKISPQFLSAGSFSEGKCGVSSEKNKYGYINTEGKYIINPQFESVSWFHQGRAIAGTGKLGVIDEEGKYIINPQFNLMLPDGEGYLVAQNTEWGWIDKEGKYIVNPQFKGAFPFLGNAIAPVLSGDSWGYIDREGKYQINPQFDGATAFDGHMALVKSGSKYGFIDKEGKYLINPQFEDVADDYVSYQWGSTHHEGRVQTDYFNLQAILDKVKNDITPVGVSGISFDMPFAEIMTKFGKTQEEVNRYGSEQHLKQGDKIANVATHNFSVTGDFFGYDNSYNYVMNRQAKPTAFTYTINGTGKGYGKENQIMEAIEKQGLSGFRKDAQASDTRQKVFINNRMTATMTFRYGQINIVFTPRKAQAES